MACERERACVSGVRASRALCSVNMENNLNSSATARLPQKIVYFPAATAPSAFDVYFRLLIFIYFVKFWFFPI